MQRVINRSVGNRWYNVWERNCATFVEEVLRAGGGCAGYDLPPRLVRAVQADLWWRRSGPIRRHAECAVRGLMRPKE
jgi:hypothetical protein